ncbi:MAG: uroporphyrinogen decarboxylase family protein [bacterium]
MNDRERFLATMRYQDADRAPYWGAMGAWPETIERWKGEGYGRPDAPKIETDRRDWQSQWFFPNPPFEREIVSEDEDTVLYINHEGILMREFKKNPMSSMPQFVRFPVETREEFRRFWKERMNPDPSSRIGPDWKEKMAAYRDRDFPLIVISDRWGGFFGPLRNLLGVERLCMLFYDDPAFVEEMMDANADFIIEMMAQILDQTDIDVYGFWEDMAYRTGPLIGPEMVRRFMLPRYRRVVDFLRSRGVEFISLDSDGNISSLIPIWLDAGINILYPFEVQAGMDVLKVRREYGRQLRIWYGIDKRALARGPKEIDEEVARVAPLVEDGGYIPGLDHSAPPDISFENYCYYMRKLREIL